MKKPNKGIFEDVFIIILVFGGVIITMVMISQNSYAIDRHAISVPYYLFVIVVWRVYVILDKILYSKTQKNKEKNNKTKIKKSERNKK